MAVLGILPVEVAIITDYKGSLKKLCLRGKQFSFSADMSSQDPELLEWSYKRGELFFDHFYHEIVK